MPVRKPVTVSMSTELHAVAERLITSGRYGNVSEVVRAGLRLLDEREQAFQTHTARGAAALGRHVDKGGD